MTNEAADIAGVTLDMGAVQYHNPQIEYEREVIIRDLLEKNHFILNDGGRSPYHLHMTMKAEQLTIEVSDAAREVTHALLNVSMRPFKRLIKDYFIIWESYSEALKTGSPEKLQAVDMGRRATHDEGARLLEKRLQNDVDTDFDTLRGLFSLICVLHIK